VSANTGRAALLAALIVLPVLSAARDLVDQCVGGRWDEILAQSGILHGRNYPEYGLTEKLAFECPSFVHQVITAGSLDAAAKRKVFAEAPGWPAEKIRAFHRRLVEENRKAFDEAWKTLPTERDRAQRQPSRFPSKESD
jgi:hypothetical protein